MKCLGDALCQLVGQAAVAVDALVRIRATRWAVGLVYRSSL
jgi:hypothetical protein